MPARQTMKLDRKLREVTPESVKRPMSRTLLEHGTRSSTPDADAEIDSMLDLMAIMETNRRLRQKKRKKNDGRKSADRLRGLFGSSRS